MPIYHADGLVRRGEALSISSYGKQGRVRMNANAAAVLGLSQGADVNVEQGGSSARSKLSIDPSVPDGCVRIPLATEVSAALGASHALIKVVAA